MNKTDRLLAIVLKLQSSGGMRAEDLAAFFETSKRTIYRDIQALSEAGVPLIATPGQGYALVEGYFLPPLSFSSDEAIMLLLGAEYLAQNFDDRYRDGAKAAATKIEGVLPQNLAKEVANLKNNFRMVTQPIENPDLLKELRRAILERKTIKFRYFGRSREPGGENATEREVDPYGLIFVEGIWYLPGYDHLRQDIRSFRLDRVENLSFTTRTFIRRPDFVLGKVDTTHERDITVRLLFVPEAARWVRETRYFYLEGEEETSEGLEVTLKIRHLRDPLNWIMSWGARVRVLEPEALAEIVRQEAEAIFKQYKNGV